MTQACQWADPLQAQLAGPRAGGGAASESVLIIAGPADKTLALQASNLADGGAFGDRIPLPVPREGPGGRARALGLARELTRSLSLRVLGGSDGPGGRPSGHCLEEPPAPPSRSP